MNKIKKLALAIAMALSFVLPAFTATAHAADLEKELHAKLVRAIAQGNSADAANWATARAQYEQALLVREQRKAAQVFDNILKSIPAVLDGVELYNRLQKHPDSEVTEMLAVIRTLIRVFDKPLNCADIIPLVHQINANEKARRKAWEERERERSK